MPRQSRPEEFAPLLRAVLKAESDLAAVSRVRSSLSMSSKRRIAQGMCFGATTSSGGTPNVRAGYARLCSGPGASKTS